MNDETREQLSAYLDGALPDDERRELESRLAASAELRGALEDLRAVSRAVKDLPKEPLPPGFMTRFQGRRARGEAPRADWVFLPPAARPVVGALSFGVVALVIWSKVQTSPQPLLHPDETAQVAVPGSAPVSQLDLTRAVISGAAGSVSSDAKSLQIAGAAAPPARATDRPAVEESAGGAAADEMKAAAGKISGVSAMRGANARAAGAPIAAQAAPASEPQLTDRTRQTMTEEERSARNEQLFAQLEGQKKQMGMRVLPKDEDAEGDSEHRGFLGLREPPAAPAIHAAVPSLLGSAKKKGALAEAVNATALAAKPAAANASGRLAPDAALVFSDPSSLASSWVLLGLPGDPPSADFVTGRVVVIKPSATKILSVTPGPDAVTVVFRSLQPDEESDPAKDRVAPLPATPKAVLIYDASPR